MLLRLLKGTKCSQSVKFGEPSEDFYEKARMSKLPKSKHKVQRASVPCKSTVMLSFNLLINRKMHSTYSLVKKRPLLLFHTNLVIVVVSMKERLFSKNLQQERTLVHAINN